MPGDVVEIGVQMIEQQICSRCGWSLEDTVDDSECPRCLLAAGMSDTHNSETENIGQVGPYRLIESIGKGGMGIVFKAEDTRLGRQVAIKFLPSLMRDNHELFSRFQREARALSRTSSPHLCIIHDVGESERGPYLVMEYLNGETIKDRLQRGVIPVAEFLDLSLQLVQGVQAAHAAGVIHRDLKPANIIVTGDGVAKIVDFGLVKLKAPTAPIGETQEYAATRQTLATQHDRLLGTVPYMSPEQAAGHEVDQRSDLFSLGTLFYEMVTGKRPFGGSTTMLTIHAILSEDFTPAHEVDASIPLSLSNMISKLLNRDPAARFSNADALAARLRELGTEPWASLSVPADLLLTSQPRVSRWHRSAFATLAALALAVVLFMAWKLRDNPQVESPLAAQQPQPPNGDPDHPAEPDWDQFQEPDFGEVLDPAEVRGLVIEPVPYLDQLNPMREDSVAAKFMADLQFHMAASMRRQVPVIPVTKQEWDHSIHAMHNRLPESSFPKVGMNLPDLKGNILFTMDGQFVPDEKRYVYYLRLFNEYGRQIFRRGFVFQERELHGQPENCFDAIMSTPIFQARTKPGKPIDPGPVQSVVIEPIFNIASPFTRFEFVSDQFRESLRQQLSERINRDIRVVPASLDDWQVMVDKDQGGIHFRIMDYFKANALVSVRGMFREDTQSYDLDLTILDHDGLWLFRQRFVYGRREFEQDPEVFRRDILATKIFQKPRPSE